MIKNRNEDWNRFLAFCKGQQYFRKRFDQICRSEIFTTEAAKILKCQPSLIRRAIEKKKLFARRIGRYFLINKSDLWVFFCIEGHWNGKMVVLSV